jgi:hypothetical protein
MSQHTYNDLLRIKAIYEKDGTTSKESHQYRVGRLGYIENLNRSTPLYFRYLDGHGTLMTSNVKSFEESENELKVETTKTIYLFEYVK